MIALDPTAEQISLFKSHGAAARIARNDLIALWREEGNRLPGFRYGTSEPRTLLNKTKLKAHPWFKDLSQNAVKSVYADPEDAIARFYSAQNRRRFHGKSRRFAFRADDGVDSVKILGKVLTLPKKMGGAVKTPEPLR